MPHYNARYYNPAIARFVSADTVAPGLGNPQVRNRYSYTINNPLRFTDPTGHCSESNGVDDRGADEENARCASAVNQLTNYGISIEQLTKWLSNELESILTAAEKLRDAAAWSLSDFKAAIGGGVTFVRDAAYGDKAGFQDKGKIWMYDLAFAPGKDTIHVIIHELAHRWDEASGSDLSWNMVAATGGWTGGCNNRLGECLLSAPGQADKRPRETPYFNNPYEDFAESVAARVTGNMDNPDFRNSTRWNYVNRQFDRYRSTSCKTCQ